MPTGFYVMWFAAFLYCLGILALIWMWETP